MRIHIGAAQPDGNGHIIIDRQYEYDDGTIESGVFIMPEDTLEWRAAEYGIDPDDLDTLMDVVLAECYLIPDFDNKTPDLFTAATIDEARERHLQRCSQIKLQYRMTTRGKDHPLTEGRKHFVMHKEALELKRQIVGNARQAHKMSALVNSQESKNELRVQALRRQLNGETL